MMFRRIWPGVFLTIIFFTGPARLLLSGPLKAAYEQFYLKRCRNTWWWDLTFFTNALMRVSHARETHKGPVGVCRDTDKTNGRTR